MTTDLRDDLGRLESRYLDTPLDVDDLVARATASGARERRRHVTTRAVSALAVAGLLCGGGWGVASFRFGEHAQPAASFTYPPQRYTPPAPQPADRAAVQADLERVARASLPGGTSVDEWTPAASEATLIAVDTVIKTSRGHGTWGVAVYDDRMPDSFGKKIESGCPAVKKHPCTQRAVPGGLLVEEVLPTTVNGEPVVPHHQTRAARMVRPDHSVVEVSMTDAADRDTFGPRTTMPLTPEQLSALAVSPDLVPLTRRYQAAWGADAYTRPTDWPTPVPVTS